MTAETAAHLVIHDKEPRTLPIGKFFTIGSSEDNDFRIDDPHIAPRHARIEKTDKGYLIRDMRTHLGTFVNGTKILEAFLNFEDSIQLGSVSMVFSNSEKSSHPILESKNSEWNAQLTKVPDYAKSDYPILLLGDSGTGKDVLARAIHEMSLRAGGPLISLNCSALSETLIESELFGHVRGSFTGAINDRKGAFELARGGTLFLDEIGDLPISLQPKLLRALENKEIWPIGGDRFIKTDVRIIAATHQSLKNKIQEGNFRSDLYYRLNIISFQVPSLKDRIEDFDDLFFKFAKEVRVRFSFNAIEELKKYSWPGNIRQLKNVVARAGIEFKGKQVEPENVIQLLEQASEGAIEEKPFPRISVNLPIVKEFEREVIIQRLLANSGNQRRTALDLRMPKSTLHDRLKVYGIDPKQFKRKGYLVDSANIS